MDVEIDIDLNSFPVLYLVELWEENNRNFGLVVENGKIVRMEAN